jgi:hypothetical protein
MRAGLLFYATMRAAKIACLKNLQVDGMLPMFRK